MNSKLMIGILTILGIGVAFLAYQNLQLKYKLKELSKPTEQVSITPLKTDSASLVNQSPFDDLNNQMVLPQETPSADKLAVIGFEKTKHDFGRINEGDKVSTTFTFKNTGKVPLIIRDAQGSCGCTVPKWPSEPIPVGREGSIEVTFDSNGKSGQTEKTVTVTANTQPSNTVLILKSTIIPKDR